MLIIGSIALQKHIPSLDMSKNRDIDVLCTSDDMLAFVSGNNNIKSFRPAKKSRRNWLAFLKNDRIIEFEVAEPGTSAHEILLLEPNLTKGRLIDNDGGIGNAVIAPIHILYLIKMSHRYKKNSPFFNKTMDHIHLIRKEFPLADDIFDQTGFAIMLRNREKESYDYSHPNLNVDKKSFFNPDIGVKYVYDHDEIHKIMARGERPAYTYFIKDGADVYCDKDKFFALPKEIQLNAVLEESLVLALERSQIPYKGQLDPKQSFNMALEKVCTSITSGWFREFAWEHYHEVQQLYPIDYAEVFFSAVDNGIIKQLAV